MSCSEINGLNKYTCPVCSRDMAIITTYSDAEGKTHVLTYCSNCNEYYEIKPVREDKVMNPNPRRC
jgi:transcription elongation factor Elf1